MKFYTGSSISSQYDSMKQQKNSVEFKKFEEWKRKNSSTLANDLNHALGKIRVKQGAQNLVFSIIGTSIGAGAAPFDADSDDERKEALLDNWDLMCYERFKRGM